MAADAEALRDDPFALLQAMELRLRAAKLDIAGGQEEVWVGLGFRVADRWLVAPRADVREVIAPPPLTRVPGAQPWLLGVANVRGNLLPITDLAGLLEQPRAPTRREQRVLVLNSEGIPAGFLVHEVAGYRQFAPGDQRHELARQAGRWTPFLLGAFAREGRAWLALSLQRLSRSEVFVHAGA